MNITTPPLTQKHEVNKSSLDQLQLTTCTVPVAFKVNDVPGLLKVTDVPGPFTVNDVPGLLEVNDVP